MADKTMEQSLLLKDHHNSYDKTEQEKDARTALTWPVFIQEVKNLGFIAGPMVAVVLSQYLLQVVSLMMVGHLGELALSSTAIATSLSGVSGFSLLVSCFFFFFVFL